MRIAVSGSHRTGKSSLIEGLSQSLRGYAAVDEPYCLMAAEGYEFGQPPSFEDFEAQLDRSLEELSRPESDVLFDRCPVDILGYLLAHGDQGSVDVDRWVPRVRSAIQRLDLIVFVPVESPDRIDVPASDDFDNSRHGVHEHLREILLEDCFDLGVGVLEVAGRMQTRMGAVLQWIDSKGDR